MPRDRRPGARAWWRSRALTGAEPRESEQGWHRGGDGVRRWGSWTSPAGQVSAEREVGGDPAGSAGPGAHTCTPGGDAGAMERPTDARTGRWTGREAGRRCRAGRPGPRSSGAQGGGLGRRSPVAGLLRSGAGPARGGGGLPGSGNPLAGPARSGGPRRPS